MKLYLNELAPWERKNEYFHHIQLGKDVKSQTSILHDAIIKQTRAHLSSASAIIASQERISEGIDKLGYGIDRVEQGIYGLQATFEWGISEVVWQIEQNREVLKNILEVLKAPLDTQAEEYKKRGEYAYSNGLFDDAIEEFLESEKRNKFDFSIYISIGMIYIFQKINREKALEFFEKAVKYAKPKSTYHASFALLHAALIYRDLDQLSKAERLTADAISLSPDFAEALYQNSQYNAQLRNAPKSIVALEKAVLLDKHYCLKADSDQMFDPIRNDVNNLFRKMRDRVLNKCEDLMGSQQADIDRTNGMIGLTTEFYPLEFEIDSFASELMDVEKRINRKSYYDGIDAQLKLVHLSTIIGEYRQYANNYLEIINKKIAATIYDLEKELAHKPQRETDKKRSALEDSTPLTCLTWFLLVVASIAVSTLYVVLADKGGGRIEPIWPLILFLIIGSFLFWGGGWFVGKVLLSFLANLIYTTDNYSQYVIDMKHRIEKAKAVHSKFRAIFTDYKS